MDSDKIARGRPEATDFDRNRHAAMKLRPMGMYGDPKVFMSVAPLENCTKCGGAIVSDHLIISGRHYHGKCFRCEK